MKLFKYAFLATLFLTAATACNDDNPWQFSDKEGGLAVHVKANPDVKDAIPTRATAFCPDTQLFGLKLTKNDGSSSESWNSLSEFPETKTTGSGDYTLEAFFGSPEDEGFNKPYYHGAEIINVRPGELTEASVTASLANSMVDVAYTDAFKNYFADFSTSLHSEGYGHHAIPADVQDALYIHPGKIAITVDFTKPNGQSATIQPAEFTAEPRHYYHLTLDVNNGQVGDAQLVIRFDDSIATEDVEIDLSDELLNVPAPEVTTTGFENGQVINQLENTPAAGNLKFTAYAPGGIRSAVLTVQSDSFTPSFGREVELVNADAATRQNLENAGIKVLGLFNNPDKLASVDIANFCGALPTGNHIVTLVVKDALTRVNEPVSCTISCEPLTLSFVKADPSPLGSTDGTVFVSYNGVNPMQNITVKGLDDNGIWVDCPITSASLATSKRGATRSDAFPASTYQLNLSVPNTTRDLKLAFYYKGKLMAQGTLLKEIPDYTLTSNDYATRTVLKVGGAADNVRQWLVRNMRFFAGGSEVPGANITRNADTGEISISGLKPSTQYHIYSTPRSGSDPEMSTDITLTTEANAQVENGAMESWAQLKHDKKTYFFVGADYYEWFANATTTQSYWATRNPMTTYYEGQSTLSYTVYSGTRPTDSGRSGKGADIMTIGWGQGNTFAGGASIIKHKTAGMLFMGDYSYDGSEHLVYGRPFTSRPTSLSFYYKYAPISGESFRAYAVIENRSNGTTTELARAELTSGTAVNEFTLANLPLQYSNTALKATHAYIVFISSTAASPQTSPSSYNGENVHLGSKLTVDDIVFNY